MRKIAFALCLCLWFVSTGVPVWADEIELPEEVTLYYLTDELIAKGVTLPADHPSAYQFPTGSEARYCFHTGSGLSSAANGKYYLRVTETGLAETMPPNPQYTYPEIPVYVIVNGRYRIVKFHVESYEQDYADLVLDDYLARELTPGMSDLEKMKKLTEVVARDFDYGKHASYAGMFIYGSGDCWASTSFLLAAAARLGIAAGGHPEPWESPTHRNAIALIDGALYVFEAGYSGTKPRDWDWYALEGDYKCRMTVDVDGSTAARVCRNERMYAEPNSPSVIDMTIPATYTALDGYTETYVTYPVVRIGYGDYRVRLCSVKTRSVKLPETLQVIDAYAFSGAAQLTDVTLPNSLREIGEYAFNGCTSLGEIVLPKKITALPAYVFANCGTLTVYVPASVTSIDENAFSGTDVTLTGPRFGAAETFARENGLTFRYSDKTLRLPEGLQTVEERAFMNTAAQGIIVPDGVTSIGKYAFSTCKKLKWVELPASVTEIPDNAFYGRYGLTIAAPSGSAAETFAKKKHFNFYALD